MTEVSTAEPIGTALAQVVALNEGAKAIRRSAFEVNLRALGAIVQSRRAGASLRGFSEVSTQMQRWSESLEAAAARLTKGCTARVRVVSDDARRGRQQALLRRALASSARSAEAAALPGEDAAPAALRRSSREVRVAVSALQELGLMATVLARAALVEACEGNEQQRRDLSEISREFAAHAEDVNAVVRVLVDSTER
ncbi:MAG: hypothetical protein U0325_21890 [Polyangiales bacterium]